MNDRAGPGNGMEKGLPLVATRMMDTASTSPRPGFPHSLRWKMVMSLSAVLLMVVAVAAFALFRFQWTFLMQENQKRVDSLAMNLAANAMEPLLAGDDLRLGPMVESVLAVDDVQYAFVSDHNGRIVYHSDPERIGTTVSKNDTNASDVLRGRAPVLTEDVRTGSVEVGLGMDHIYSAMTATVLGLTLPLAAAALLGLISVLFISTLHIRRLKELENAMQALGDGNLLINVDVEGRDEVGRMALYFNEMVDQLNQARRRSFDNYAQTISALAAAVEAKDSYTGGHCDRVAMMSAAMAGRLGMNESTQRDLKLAAVLHDIGKIGIDNEIIGKGGPLDDRQTVNIRNHAEIGSNILERLASLSRVSLYVKHHHERFDGRGYPSGLRGDTIPLPSRIIHLVDAYDAMTTDRPYRRALKPEVAIKRLKTASGTQFDPTLVDAFIKLYEEGVIRNICEGPPSAHAISQVL